MGEWGPILQRIHEWAALSLVEGQTLVARHSLLLGARGILIDRVMQPCRKDTGRSSWK